MSAIQSIRLSDLSGRVQRAVTDIFANQAYWVIADVTSYTFYQQKGYHYFDLVEKEDGSNLIVAKMAAVAWGPGANAIGRFEQQTGQPFKNDINVLAKVSVSYHHVYGLQLTLIDIDTSFTIGLLEQQKQETLSRLLRECPDFIRKEGDRYITRNNQLVLRPVIQKIAVVTSNNSAGYQDFKHTLDNNRFRYQFSLDNYFTVVQGEANADLIRQKLIDIFNSGTAYDAVVIIRGGGAQTDFLIFDTYALGQVVAKFPIPVITGIGHQKNETIVDMMAHSPTKTPTKAAEFIIAQNKAFEETLTNTQKDIVIRSQQLFSSYLQTISSLNASIVNRSRTILSKQKDELTRCHQVVINTSKSILFGKRSELMAVSGEVTARPKGLVVNKSNDLKNIVSNLHSFNRIYFQNKRSYISHHETVFRLMSPANILKKGFALVYHKGKIVSDPALVLPGNDIQVLLSDAEINAKVTSKKTTNGTEFNI